MACCWRQLYLISEERYRWLISMLRASDKQRLRWDVVKTALELEFRWKRLSTSLSRS